ncbi:MAG TPA: hypothetical protein ENI38_01805 [Candidatus Acetothermia bacterium]|nr:hypothetical protein [Candidatus Acetothermia bacterium]
MNGKSPLEKLRELGWDLPDKFACFPVILLDEVAVIWASKGGHDVLAYYNLASSRRDAMVPLGDSRPKGGGPKGPSQLPCQSNLNLAKEG